MLQIVFIDDDDFQFNPEIRSKMTAILKRAEKDVRVLIPSLSKRLTFTIYPTNNVIPETGETASTVGKSWIRFSIDPHYSRSLEEIVDSELRRTFFHEAHHAARFQTEEWGNSIIENAIFEGTATVFERKYADGEPLWGKYDPSVIQAWTQEVLNLADDTPNGQQWFFTHSDGRRWIAYRVGTYIVDQALKHNPMETAATLVNVPAKKILEMSRVESS